MIAAAAEVAALVIRDLTRILARGQRAMISAKIASAIDVDPATLEPGAHVDDVAVEEVEALDVGGDVDRLREVDEPELIVPPEQVVGRQVAVGEPLAGQRRQPVDELVERGGQIVAVADERPGAGGRPSRSRR